MHTVTAEADQWKQHRFGTGPDARAEPRLAAEVERVGPLEEEGLRVAEAALLDVLARRHRPGHQPLHKYVGLCRIKSD